MSRIEHRTRASLAGVFVIDEENLRDLDEIIGEVLKRLRKVRSQEINKKKNDARIEAETRYANSADETLRNKWIEEAVERAGDSYPLSQNKIEWTWNCKEGQKLHTTTIREAIDHPIVQAQEIEEFALSIACGRYDCEIDMSDWTGTSIDIRVSPSHLSESSRIFNELERWAKTHRLPRLFYWWTRFRPVFVGVSIYWFFVLSIIAFVFFFRSNDNSNSREQSSIRESAELLLSEGVDSANEHQALELLLEIQLHGIPPEEIRDNSQQKRAYLPFNSFWLLSFPFWIALCFPPTTIIGIGKGVEKLRRMRIWVKILVVLIPTFLLLGVLPSVLGSMIYDFFGM